MADTTDSTTSAVKVNADGHALTDKSPTRPSTEQETTNTEIVEKEHKSFMKALAQFHRVTEASMQLEQNDATYQYVRDSEASQSIPSTNEAPQDANGPQLIRGANRGLKQEAIAADFDQIPELRTSAACPDDDDRQVGAIAVAGIMSGRRPGLAEEAVGQALLDTQSPQSLDELVMCNQPVIQAHLVEDHNEVAAAEIVKGEPVHKAQLANLIVLSLVILLVGIIAVVLGNTKNKKDASGHSWGNNVDDTEAGPCFDTSEALKTAVDAYYNDSSPNSAIAQTRGWPIGDWCFEDTLDSLSNVFQAGSNEIQETDKSPLDFTPLDVGDWDVSRVKDFGNMFDGGHNISSYWGIGRWDTSNATVIQNLFANTLWNDDAPLDLSGWNVSKVWQMSYLFHNSNLRFANISDWDTSEVRLMERLAEYTPRFNEDLSRWDTSLVISMEAAFSHAMCFNQDLSKWDTSHVTTMNNLFSHTQSYNQPMDAWDVSSVQDISQIFSHAVAFNQDISGWDVSHVSDLRWAFTKALSFNQNLCAWGAKLPSFAEVDDMFVRTSCPNQSTPILAAGGPFCFDCTSNEAHQGE